MTTRNANKPNWKGQLLIDQQELLTCTSSNYLLYIGGVVVAWIVVVVGFAVSNGGRALMTGELSRPNPLTCQAGSCWDGAIKYGYSSSTVGTGQLVLGVEIPKEQSTCYKSIYFNLESNSAMALFVFCCFVAFIARAVEYLATLALSKSLRFSVMFPLIGSFVGFYYSFVFCCQSPVLFCRTNTLFWFILLLDSI